jgi:hypothetical protein
MALEFFFKGVKVRGRLAFTANGGMFRATEAPVVPIEGQSALPFTVEPCDIGDFVLTPHDPDNFTASFSVPFEIRGPHVQVRVENFEGPAEIAWPSRIGSMILGPLRPGRYQPLEDIGEAERD